MSDGGPNQLFSSIVMEFHALGYVRKCVYVELSNATVPSQARRPPLKLFTPMSATIRKKNKHTIAMFMIAGIENNIAFTTIFKPSARLIRRSENGRASCRERGCQYV